MLRKKKECPTTDDTFWRVFDFSFVAGKPYDQATFDAGLPVAVITESVARRLLEERMNGQRVVKVFNHENKSKEEFDKLNEQLFESAANANTFANMMGPVIGNIGNLQFVLTAVLGGFLSVQGVGGITLGVMASYLQFTKSFTQPFMQVAQQFNSIVMALA